MNILITGGAGYIGSHTIIEILEHTDWTPISIDDHRNSSPETYDRIEAVTGTRIKSYNMDLADLEGLRIVFKENNIQGVIHFAALKMVGDSVKKPLLYYQNNIDSLVNVLRVQHEFGVHDHIFSSSCSVYGNARDPLVTEQTSLAPAESPYGNTKVIGERILHDFYVAAPEMRLMALRYFNPVGAHSSGTIGEVPHGVPSNLVPYITQTAIGMRESLIIFGGDYDTPDGTCIRDYIHVSDIADAHIKALQHLFKGKQGEAVEIINLGTGNGVSVLEAVKSFERVSESKLNYAIGPRRAGDVIAVYADNSKARAQLGWSPRYDLDAMMLSAWKWQQHLSDY